MSLYVFSSLIFCIILHAIIASKIISISAELVYYMKLTFLKCYSGKLGTPFLMYYFYDFFLNWEHENLMNYDKCIAYYYILYSFIRVNHLMYVN